MVLTIQLRQIYTDRALTSEEEQRKEELINNPTSPGGAIYEEIKNNAEKEKIKVIEVVVTEGLPGGEVVYKKLTGEEVTTTDVAGAVIDFIPFGKTGATGGRIIKGVIGGKTIKGITSSTKVDDVIKGAGKAVEVPGRV